MHDSRDAGGTRPADDLQATTYQASAPALCPGMHDAPYLDALLAHARSAIEHLTVPGHKGGTAAPEALAPLLANAAAHDVPLLIEGLDQLGPLDPDDDGHGTTDGVVPRQLPPLAEAQRRAARAWGAAHTWFLTQGATQGNLAAALALAARGGTAVVQRSAHVSTFNGLALAGVPAVYVRPEIDAARGIPHAVTPDPLDRALRSTPAASAVLLTSPTYHGTAADLHGLVGVAHAHGAAVIVDESWGAHLRFGAHLPVDALAAGADLVISSTHKHLGSLGGSAMLHLGHGAPAWLTQATVERALALVTSTSPSSILLASLDAARARAEHDGAALLAEATRTLDDLRAAIAEIPGCVPLGAEQIGRYGIAGIDPLRLCVDVRGTGWSGQQVARLARAEHGLEFELAQTATVVLCFGLGESPAVRGARLVAALADASRRARASQPAAPLTADGAARPPRGLAPPLPSVARPALGMREAMWAEHRTVPLAEAQGCIAAEPLTPYPPGIPLVLPGERIGAGVLRSIERWVAGGGHMRALADPTAATVRVVDTPPTRGLRHRSADRRFGALDAASRRVVPA